jgi:hypothetical protein
VASVLNTNNIEIKRLYLPLLLLLLVTSALFFPVLNHDFVNFDDELYIVNDMAQKQLNLANLKAILFEPYQAAWYPLTRLSHALEFALFGGSATATHLVNVILHFINAALLFLITLQLGRLAYPDENPPASFVLPGIITSLLFLVHPQHVEAVAWAVQRKELLATMFSLLSITMYLRHQLLPAIIFALMAMLSKASSVVLPAFFVLLNIALIKPDALNIKSLLEVVWANRWILILALVMTVLTYINHEAENTQFLEEHFSPLSRLMLYADNSLLGLANFVMLKPGLFHLPINEYIVTANGIGFIVLVIMLILLTIFCAVLFKGSRRARICAMGVLFYFTALLPVGGLVVFGNYAFGDRYLYLSSIGLYVVVFIGLCEVMRKFSSTSAGRWLLVAPVILLIVAFSMSMRGLPKWSDSISLWSYDVIQRPDSVFANHQLGAQYFLANKYHEAVPYFVAAINSDSNHFRVWSRTASSLYLAEIMCNDGQEQSAIQALERIPGFGGDIKDVEMLLGSLSYSGYDICEQAISAWYSENHANKP